ncbi:hypothetical protein EC991_007306 [Linnemannia zychae]|nr:hypothetical protein EC991_007306 [Linnemannia zychae]
MDPTKSQSYILMDTLNKANIDKTSYNPNQSRQVVCSGGVGAGNSQPHTANVTCLTGPYTFQNGTSVQFGATRASQGAAQSTAAGAVFRFRF